MQVSQPDVARKGLTLAGALFLSELGMMLLGQLAGSVFGSGWQVIQAVGWLAITLGLGVAAFKLSTALADTELPKVLLGLIALMLMSELFWLWRQLMPGGLSGPGSALSAVSGLSTLISGAHTVAWCLLLGALARPTLGWAVPAASVVGMLALAGVTFTLVLVFRLVDPMALLGFPATMWIRSGMAVVIALGLAALALGARGGLEGIARASPAAAVVAAEPGAARLVITGAALLIVGIGVTAASYGAASGGGRYVVATGAIATGVVQLVRGLTRLGAQS